MWGVAASCMYYGNCTRGEDGIACVMEKCYRVFAGAGVYITEYRVDAIEYRTMVFARNDTYLCRMGIDKR